jgi:hypothetical protein
MGKFTPKRTGNLSQSFHNFASYHMRLKKKSASEKYIFDFRCGIRFESDVTWNDLGNR